jgi:hypothetical protein
MADNPKASGRIYLMVGMMAVVAIMLALIAPGLSRSVVDRAEDERRLGPVERESATLNESPPRPDSFEPRRTADLPLYGAEPGFGEPMLDEGFASAPIRQREKQRQPSGSAPSPPTSLPPAGVQPQLATAKPGNGAAEAGLEGEPYSWTKSYPRYPKD